MEHENETITPPTPIDYIVWDLETTGFVAPECKILEIGAYIVRGDLIEERHWVLQNNVEIPEKITEITGITKEIIDAEGKDPKECIEEFLGILLLAKKHITHNGFNFDIPFLVNTAADLFGYTDEKKRELTDELRAFAYDTAVYFKSKKLGMAQWEEEHYCVFADRVMRTRAYVKFNLGLSCDESGVSREGIAQHRALADVYLTHCLYKKIMAPEEI